VEQVKEAASSEGLQLLGPTLIYRDSLERPRSVPMQPYLGSVVLSDQHMRGWVQSSSGLLRELCGKCTTFAELKLTG
jgi:hypothetical protein